jgi:hypothetical protein
VLGAEGRLWGVAFEKAVRRKPLAFAVDAGLSMEFQSIFARFLEKRFSQSF